MVSSAGALQVMGFLHLTERKKPRTPDTVTVLI